MKRKFTRLTAALALLVGLAIPLGMWGQTVVTFTPGTDTGATSVTKGAITATMTTMNNASYYQIYANASGTFSTSDGNITKIEFTCTASGTSKYGPGNASANVGNYSYEGPVGTWTGSAQSVTISTTAQIRMTSLEVTYIPSGGGGTTTYTVTYHANVTGIDDIEVVYNEGDDVTVAANTFSNPGYAFTEWTTEADGSGDSYDPDDVIEDIDSDIDLYAQWEESTSTTGTINFGSASGSTNINTSPVTGDDSEGNTWTITTEGTTSFTPNANYAQIGSSSKPATSITFTTTLPEEVEITAMSAKFGGFSGTAGTITMKVGSTTIGTGSLNGTTDVIVNSNTTATGTVLTVTVTNISKGVKAYYISYTYETISGSAVTTTTTISVPGNFNNDLHNGTNAGTLSATVTAEGNPVSGASVTWSSNNTSVATINGSGEVTLVATGTTTITASYAGVEGEYKPSSDTYELTVIDSYAPGTQNNPYTVTQALAATPANGVYVQGVISGITEVSLQYKNATYTISDGTHIMTVFRGRYLNNTDFTSTDQIQVGDQVVVTGNLSDYQGTNQLAQDNYLVSLTRPATIVIAAEELALPCTANDNGSFAVTYTNGFVSALTTADLFTDEDCTDAFQDDWIMLDDINDPYDAIPYYLEANTGNTSRTVYMKVEAMDSEFNTIEKVFTITQAGQPTYTVTYAANGGSGNMTDPDSPYIEGDIVELLTNAFTAPEGMVWSAWIVTDAGNNEVTVEGGMFEMPASNVTVTAQWVIDPNAPQYEWVLTDLADLTSTDIFVIVGTRDAASYYGMSNDKGTSTQPSAVAVTIANNKLSSVPGDNIKWNVSGDNTNGYVFYPNGSTTTWLYCNTTASSSSNTNMRVGTGDRKLFVLDNNNYLVTKDEYTDRYVSLNGSTDWRGYTTTGQATVISFFKRQVASTDPAVYTSVSAIDLAYDETGSSFTYSLENAASEYTMNVTVNSEAQSWLSATINTTTSTVTITAAVNDGEQRQGIVTVNYLEGEIIKAYEQVTVTQAEFVIDYATLPFVFVGNEDETPLGVTTNVGTYSSSPYLKFDATNKYLTLKLNEAPLSLSYDIKVNGTYGTESVFDVLTSADGQAWASLVSYTTLSTDVQTVTHLDLPSTVRYIKWIYTNKHSGNVALGNIHASANYDIYGDVTVAELTIPADKVCTVYSPATLNVTTSLTNSATSSAWEHLIIKDGAQLKTPNAVKGTIEKFVAGYGESTNGNYVLLATPATLDACNNTGMWPSETAQHVNVDFYAFDQSFAGAEWRNYKYGNTSFAGPFAMTQGTGYLYANKNDVTLTLETRGYVSPNVDWQDHPFAPTNVNQSVTLEYSDGKPFAGFNLIGNPFTCDAYINRDYYRMNAAGDAIVPAVSATTAIKPCEGIFVVAADGDDNSVTFSTIVPSGAAPANVVINLKESEMVRDRAIVSFGNERNMPRFQFNEAAAKLYIPQGEKEMAKVNSEAQGEMPVNFKASKNGTYTISVEPKNVEMNYLHLIDNRTGADVDLLATPSYSFEASITDYASRFRLVFNANDENGASTGSATFAYYNGSEWMINNMGEATLQVVDVMGRVLSTETVNGNATINLNQMPGVYMLRLVNGDSVKVQKVVVR